MSFDKITCVRFTVLCLALVYGGVLARVQYHQQGIKPDTGKPFYRFGYEANENVDNPLTRYEISDEPGHVKGRYTFRTNNNQIRVCFVCTLHLEPLYQYTDFSSFLVKQII